MCFSDDRSICTTATPDEPLEYAAHIRDKLGKRMRLTSLHYMNYDVEQNIVQIRALLVIYAEIFERCMSSMDELEIGGIAEGGKCLASFTRFGYDMVRARTGTRRLQLTTETDCSKKVFNLTPLTQLSPDVKNCIVVQHKVAPFDDFISYEDIFESTLMFREEILVPFLPKLKDHLEAVLVCLGGVDEWLHETYKHINFIDKMFGVKLDMPSGVDYYGQECACDAGAHRKSNICLQCHCPFGAHKAVWDGECKKQRCPKGNTYFKCKPSHVLQTFKPCNDSLLTEYGFNKKKFQIELEDEQRELEKFVDFVPTVEFLNLRASTAKIERSHVYEERMCESPTRNRSSSVDIGPKKSQGGRQRQLPQPQKQRSQKFWTRILKIRGKTAE